ncbi:hypothetical protein [Chryseobacterium jejuense]|uniref:hypothetical protein n=1 Tax=Chryseobacterium jejuense TaxID=445960 RepID=UPI001AE66927|nr:hypothetical protein [Chryseobacterium jejuense]MBP2617882.1 hypothetical protein [Chryseobacterium jejuense]
MKLIESFKCKQYEIVSQKLYYINQDGEVFYNNERIHINDKFSISGKYNDKIVFFEERVFSSFIFFEKQLIKKIDEYALIIHQKLTQSIYFVGINDGDDIFYALYDINDFSIRTKYSDLGFKNNISFIDSKYFISRNKYQIGLFTLENKNVWNHSFKEYLDTPTTESQKALVIHQNMISFIIFSEGITKCVILDVMTGNVLNEYPGLYGEMILDVNEIYFLSSDNISILNIETQVVQTYSITEIFEPTEIKRLLFPRWVVKNGIIYFTQSGGVDMHSGSRGAIFGALDAVSLKILWYERLSKEHGIIGTIQVENEKIYLHTQDKILFVFEKEN